MASPRYKLSELDAPLVEALERLLNLQQTRDGVVIVEEEITNRFVQFCIPPGGGLLFDLPTKQLDSDFMLNDEALSERGLILAETFLDSEGQQQYALQRNFGKAARAAARFAIVALKEICMLGELGDVVCILDEEADTAN